jgi:hypothetical protein
LYTEALEVCVCSFINFCILNLVHLARR